MSLMDKLKKNSTIKDTAILTESKFFQTKDLIQTSVPALNVALSGRLDGGLTPGLTVFAGPSKHFKTAFSLLLAKSYLDKYDDAIVLFYDSEFGTPQAYFDTFAIDTSRVIHTPITDIEQLKHDVMSQMNGIERGDHVIVIVDSVGNLASKKEVEDALDGKSVADMTRAKQMKSLFRMVTPHLTIKDIPMVVVNHTYQTMEMFSKAVVSGGTGIYYSADNIYIIGRQQEKTGQDLTGYNFIINVEKSRFVREKSKIPVEVSFEGGISKWSGLLDMAMESGHVIKPSNGWYQRVDMSTGEAVEPKARKTDTQKKDFWLPILSDQTFMDWISKRYTISSSDGIMREEITEEDIADVYEAIEE
ncbi:recombinase RecA [bacterium]|nr:recombinase RecA [bacterium]